MNTAAEVGHLLRLYLTQERRTFQFLLANSFIVPATIAYLGWMVVPDEPEALRWWMAGAVSFGLGLGGMAQVGFGILNDRFLGRLDLIRTSPISKRAYYAAHVSVAVAEAGVLVLLALVLLAWLGVAVITAAGLATALLTALCAGTAVGGLGAVIAFRAPDLDAGNTLVAITALGLVWASPVFYDIAALPVLFQPIAWLSPFTHIAALLRAALAGAPVPPVSLLAALGISALLHGVSYRLVRWSE